MVVKLEAGVMIGLGESRRLGPTKNKLAPRPFGEFFFNEAFQLLDIFNHNESSTVSV